ncbi:hypothetical protein QQS21_010823 [Conoideocrella luteorostrata]|uniref:DOC domain-containing protein n=1 Tax=Conoideocrella luteorostrata TaxID=1105319 RepID=A0AAJ0FP30_9HYPO|nr:hypothetical protein QQS21_010823 [Conoideocrella luteorostrata]
MPFVQPPSGQMMIDSPHGSPPSKQIPRRPLQELPASPEGSILATRAPSVQPLPSADQENLQALVQALVRRHDLLSEHDEDYSFIAHSLQHYYHQLSQQGLCTITQSEFADSFLAAQYAGTRLSMPYESDDSGSEPDMSVLATMRARHGGMDPQMQGINTGTYDEEAFSSQGQYEAEDSSMEERVDEEDDDEEGPEEEVEQEEAANLVDPADIGLKEISNLGRFTVSSHKPGNGIEELRSDDLKLYWQSDGPQPHKLTVYFVKRVGIRDIRFFVDYNDDESYTPTKIIFKSGTSENNLIEFATMTMDNPVGWQQVPIAGAGGEPDGNTLVSYVLQMQILENHQNGKDTHLRGIKIYAFDADAAQAGPGGGAPEDMADASFSKDGNERFNTGDKLGDIARTLAAARLEGGETGFTIPDFMREPEIR